MTPRSDIAKLAAEAGVAYGTMSRVREREQGWLLMRLEGMSNQEIARRDGVSVPVVATAFHRMKLRGVDVGRSPYPKRMAQAR